MRVERLDTSVVPIGPQLHHFLVGQDHDGHWLAIETHGLGGGIFITRAAALHYALGETAKRPGAVSIAPQPIAWP